jgi:hypothetical protein
MRHGGNVDSGPHYEVAKDGRLKSILMVVIPHKNQRYDTVGDWIEPSPGQRMISVSRCGSDESEIAVGIHEIIEQTLCAKAGITQADVDRWDLAFTGDGEPGEAEGCPYFWQHVAATEVEQAVCKAFGLPWEDHERTLGVV